MSEFVDLDAAGMRMLAVDPQAQGEGAGRALVEICLGRARSTGRRRLILHSTQAMTAAQSLYRSLGFERTPDIDVWVEEQPDTQSSPLHLMAFSLSSSP